MRKEFARKTKRDAFLRCGGGCERCGAKLSPGKYQYDHDNPDGLTGEPSLENCVVLCRPCHAAKTKQDVTQIAKAKRRQDAHWGIKPAPSRGFGRAPPQNRASTPLTKTLPPRRNPWSSS